VKHSIGLSPPELSFDNSNTAIIIGAGLAGCAAARELALRGYHCRLYDRNPSVACETSAVPAAVVRPVLSGEETHELYFNLAFNKCVKELELLNRCGVLDISPRDHDKLASRLSSSTTSFNYKYVDAEAASQIANIKVDTDGWFIKDAGWINPADVCNRWINHANINPQQANIYSIRRNASNWQLLDDLQNIIDEAPLLIIANAQHANHFAALADLPLIPVAGQLDQFKTTQTLHTVLCHKGYAVPAGSNRAWCGTTHHRTRQTTLDRHTNPDSANSESANSDRQANQHTADQLCPGLIATNELDFSNDQRFYGVRSATPDRLPLIGPIPDSTKYQTLYRDIKHGWPAHRYPDPVYLPGIYSVLGFGSRGATQALFAAELLADIISGQPDRYSLYQRIHPARFIMRRLRRGKLSTTGHTQIILS